MPEMALPLSTEEIRRIECVARRQGVARAVLLQRALSMGLRTIFMSDAVDRYRRGECGAWRAASDAGVGLWEFLDELAGRGVPFRTDEGHLWDAIPDTE